MTGDERQVSRKYDFVLRSGHKRAMIVAESTVYVRVPSAVLPEGWNELRMRAVALFSSSAI